MIERYSREEMKNLWELESKFGFYLQVELAVCDAYNKLGKISDEDLKTIKEKASFSVERIDEIEKEVGHDVIAFLTNVNENVGVASRFIHMGMTSSDVIDTAFALQIKKRYTNGFITSMFFCNLLFKFDIFKIDLSTDISFTLINSLYEHSSGHVFISEFRDIAMHSPGASSPTPGQSLHSGYMLQEVELLLPNT